MAGPGEKPTATTDTTPPVVEGTEAKNKPAGTTETVRPAVSEKTAEQKDADRRVAALEQTTNTTVADKTADKIDPAVETQTDAQKKAAVDKLAVDEAAAKKLAEEKAKADSEPKTWTELMDFFSGSYKKTGVDAVLGIGMSIYYAYKLLFGEEMAEEEKEDDGIDGPDGLHYRFEDKTVPPEDLDSPVDVNNPKVQKLLAQAKEQLLGVKNDHADWITMTQSASEKYKLGVKGPSIILGMARFESGFNPDVKAKGSSASGLGQFIKGTWKNFQDSLDSSSPYKGKPSTDPEAALNAIAWYSSENMETCGLKPEQPDFAARLYEAHHEGAAGAKKLWAFRAGGPEGKIPASYQDKEFPKYGVAKVSTYSDYSTLIFAMSARVQSVAELYQTELGTESEEELEDDEDNPPDNEPIPNQ